MTLAAMAAPCQQVIGNADVANLAVTCASFQDESGGYCFGYGSGCCPMVWKVAPTGIDIEKPKFCCYCCPCEKVVDNINFSQVIDVSMSSAMVGRGTVTVETTKGTYVLTTRKSEEAFTQIKATWESRQG